jgi:hypothetical protein
MDGVTAQDQNPNPAATGTSVPTGNSSLIYFDYTDGFTVNLPKTFTDYDTIPNLDTVYNTITTKHFRFGLDWAGDTDSVTLNPPITEAMSDNFFIMNDNPSNALCNVTATACSNTFTVKLNATNPQCNYTAQWTNPFGPAMLAIQYSFGTLSETINVGFNQVQVVGDPQFVGLRGQPYQVHGIDGAVYNIISENNLQVNSRFVFLTEGKCPIINGVADTNCWSHPGSYLGEISFQQIVNGKLHAALVTAGQGNTGFGGVQVDGKSVNIGDKVTFGTFSFEMTSAYSINVQTEHFDFQLSNSDMFVNQAVRSRVPLSRLQAHGLLGQTHSTATYPSSIKYIQGAVDDYVIADNDIFGNDFVYNQFTQ